MAHQETGGGGPVVQEDRQMRKTSKNRSVAATAAQPVEAAPVVFVERVIECVGVGILILGVMLLVCSHVILLVHNVQAISGMGILQQLFNLFAFAVIECLGLILLSGRGRLPYLSPKILSSIVGSTFGSLPKLMEAVFKGIRKSFSKKRATDRADGGSQTA
jgi:hypothetical protein